MHRTSEQGYREWMRQVDRVLVAEVGMASDDLPDWNWRDSYEAGEDAEDAAREALPDVTDGAWPFN